MVTHWRGAAIVALCALTSACGPHGHDVVDDFNSHDTGPWLALGRSVAADGSLSVHLAAAYPDQAEAIARHVVAQNRPMSIAPIRIVVDPSSGEGERHVYRWDGTTLSVDHDASGLPPRPSRAANPHGEQAAPAH